MRGRGYPGPAPAHLIEGALPSEGAIAHVLVSKYADDLPLYRQSQFYARSELALHRSTLADWVGKASFHIRPVFDCLARELKSSENLGVGYNDTNRGRGAIEAQTSP